MVAQNLGVFNANCGFLPVLQYGEETADLLGG